MKKHSYSLTGITLTSALFLTQANVFASSMSDQGLYFGVGLVQSDLVSNRQGIDSRFNTGNTTSIENNDTGLGLMTGYQIDQHLAFEFSYSDIGDVIAASNINREKLFSTDSYSISALLSYPVTSDIEIYSRLGMAFWQIYDNNDDKLESGDGLLYGVGADFNIYGQNNRLLRVEWQHQEFDNIVLANADSLSASVVFKF